VIKNVANYIFLGIAVVLIFYRIIGERLFHLNKYQFDTSGDGFKNYFSFSYQYLHGEGIWFRGMLYPFGDLAIYADAQIGIVWILQFFKLVGLNLDNYIIGVINFIPLLSFFIAGVFLLKIYGYYRVDKLWALIFTIFCLSLSPQLIRIQSHFALCYPVFIPGIWLFYITYKDLKAVKLVSLLAIILITYSAFIHPYHLLILSIFSLLYYLSNLVITKKSHWFSLLYCFIPLLIFIIIINYLDVYNDRPENPFGVFAHNTIWSDLLPYFGFVRDIVEDPVIYRHYFSEGYCYVGGLLFIVPIILLIKRFRGQYFGQHQYNWDDNRYLLISLSSLFLGASLHVLLTNGLILEILTPLKQFRGMGRVSWIFYYTFFVYLSCLFYQLFNSCKVSFLRIIMTVACLLLWMYESNEYHRTIKDNLDEFSSINHFNSRFIIKDMLNELNIDPQTFQAVLTLPISTEGVEKIDIKDDWHTKMYAMEYAYQTATPLTSCVMSRSPVSKVLSILSLSNVSSKKIDRSEFSDNPLLIVLENSRKDLYSDILGKATFLNQESNISLYQISVLDLLSSETINDTILNYSSSEECGVYFYDFMDKEEYGLIDDYSYYHKEGNSIIFDEVFKPCNGLEKPTYSLSLWYKILYDKSSIPAFDFVQKDTYGKLLMQKSFRDLHFTRVEVFEDWLRLKVNLDILNKESTIKLSVNGEHIFIDKVLLSPKSNNYIKSLDESHVYKDHIIWEI